MDFNWFIIPFLAGTVIMFAILGYKYIHWIGQISEDGKKQIRTNFFSISTLKSIKEAFIDGLIHVKIFRRNIKLGYMHMSLAFGWFLLILVGHFEAMSYEKAMFFPFQESIFFRYYAIESQDYFFSEGFTFLMDFLLLFVLSGVGLAYYKRLNKKFFGMKRTTKLLLGDKLAMTSLWLIFPLRLLAESVSAGIYGNGGFLTQSLGDGLAGILPLEKFLDPVWLAYSLSLGLFFVAMPFSRYMHIFTEVVFIFLRNWGVKLSDDTKGMSMIQANSCSRCGICIDTCQLNVADIHQVQPPYLIRDIRSKCETPEMLFNCLMCGRCEQACPVGVNITGLRSNYRNISMPQFVSNYNYLKNQPVKYSKVIYFAGCMTHLTPAIKKSMISIFKEAEIDYWFMDEDKSACCGRPLMQTGQVDAAKKLMAENRRSILASGATTMVTSCPICYKIFKEQYDLPGIRVVHHTQFIQELIEQGRLTLQKQAYSVVYHDPCELGRGGGIYEQPRQVISKIGNLIKIDQEREKALCCGGSISNLKIGTPEKRKISKDAINTYASYKPDYLVTSCPLCKKTFAENGRLPVVDIAEMVASSIIKKSVKKQSAATAVLDETFA